MKKEVKISPQKESFYLTILNCIKQGKRPPEICKDFNISKQNLNHYLRKLKELGYIEKKGYGVWEVKFSPKDAKFKVPKLVRGHAFIWSIKIPRKINGWDRRKEILDKAKIPYKEIGPRGETPRIFVNKRKVWLGGKTITIYEPKSFYGRNAIETRKYAVISLIETLKKLENKLGINLRPYTFRPAREHYGLLKNDLAIQCNRNKEKISIRDDAEGLWLWMDDSFGFGELETGGPKALLRNVQVQKWYNDHKNHNFEVTPTFILETLNGIQQNQIVFDKNMSSHLEILERLGDAINELGNRIGRSNKGAG